MSAIVKCDKCSTEAEDRTNNGFSRLTFWGQGNGTLEPHKIDLCLECTKKMTTLVLNWVKEK